MSQFSFKWSEKEGRIHPDSAEIYSLMFMEPKASVTADLDFQLIY